MRVCEGQRGSGRVREGLGGCVRVSLYLGNGNIIISLNIYTYLMSFGNISYN